MCGRQEYPCCLFEDKVELTLSNGRNILLTHTLSSFRACFANSDESFVLWNKGNTAFVEEKSIVSFRDYIESKN